MGRIVPGGDIGPEAVAPGERLTPISRDMTTTLRDDHLAATALDDLDRLWALGAQPPPEVSLRSVWRRRASSGRFALDCGVHFRAE